MDKKTLNKAIKITGSMAALARELGVTRQFVFNIKRGIAAPAWIVEKINQINQGNACK